MAGNRIAWVAFAIGLAIWLPLVILVRFTHIGHDYPLIHWGGHFVVTAAWAIVAFVLARQPQFSAQQWLVWAFSWLAVGHSVEGLGALLAGSNDAHWFHVAPVVISNLGGLVFLLLALRAHRFRTDRTPE